LMSMAIAITTPESKTLTCWENPQDGYIETDVAPKWAETFEMTSEDVMRNNQINSSNIDLVMRMEAY